MIIAVPTGSKLSTSANNPMSGWVDGWMGAAGRHSCAKEFLVLPLEHEFDAQL
jgi:hypothetical protein